MIVTRRWAQRGYETREGQKRTVWELTAEDAGLSLRAASAAQGGASASWAPEPAAV